VKYESNRIQETKRGKKGQGMERSQIQQSGMGNHDDRRSIDRCFRFCDKQHKISNEPVRRDSVYAHNDGGLCLRHLGYRERIGDILRRKEGNSRKTGETGIQGESKMTDKRKLKRMEQEQSDLRMILKKLGIKPDLHAFIDNKYNQIKECKDMPKGLPFGMYAYLSIYCTLSEKGLGISSRLLLTVLPEARYPMQYLRILKHAGIYTPIVIPRAESYLQCAANYCEKLKLSNDVKEMSIDYIRNVEKAFEEKGSTMPFKTSSLVAHAIYEVTKTMNIPLTQQRIGDAIGTSVTAMRNVETGVKMLLDQIEDEKKNQDEVAS